MVGIGRALMLSPDLLLLDEPSAGLAPVMRDMVFEKIAEVNRAGTSILIVEQNARGGRLEYPTAGTCLRWAGTGSRGAGWNYLRTRTCSGCIWVGEAAAPGDCHKITRARLKILKL